jgi:hypothetical protein
MSDLPSSSFIPKRNPGNKSKPTRRYNFFILSILSYALFVAAPLASAGVFIYDRQADIKFSQAVRTLKTEIETFSEADLARVVDFDERLQASGALLDSHVSLLSIFSILESATAGTVQFTDLKIERTDKNSLTVDASLRTSALDGVLFQRTEYKAKNNIASSSLSDITLISPDTEVGKDGKISVASDAESKGVELKAQFVFSADTILYTPLQSTATTSVPITPIATTTISNATSGSNATTL